MSTPVQYSTLYPNVDAKLAGTDESAKATLFITDSESGKSFAITGRNKLDKDKYGIFVSKGVMMNVRNASIEQFFRNDNCRNLKQMLGLKQNVKYEDVTKLRYGKIIILTNNNPNGVRFTGSVINMFHYFWPELLLSDGFINKMNTPLIKIKNNKGNIAINGAVSDVGIGITKYFYTQKEYDNWVKDNDLSKWTQTKYFMELGGFNESEVGEVFDNFPNNVVNYKWEIPTDDSNGVSKSHNAIILAYDQDKGDDRRKWINKYDKNNTLEYDSKNEVTYSDFVNKELIHFCAYDNVRSIPSVIDGLKPTQRKILYTCLKLDQNNPITVARLACYVSEKTNYKHGEQSLVSSICTMCQNFVGSNNVNLLCPLGNFGSRYDDRYLLLNGRVLGTHLEPITRKIFIDRDDGLLKYQKEEGCDIEPEVYYPIIPMVLVNGAIGIGIGISTNVPPYNPIDICNNLLAKLDGKDMIEMLPFYKNFKGKIQKIDNTQYKITGVYEILDNDTIKITEIPVVGAHSKIDRYEGYLRTLDKIFDVQSNCGINSIDITVIFKPKELTKLIASGGLEKYLNLSATISAGNMYLYNTHNIITHYETPQQIMEEFYELRLGLYNERKVRHLKMLSDEMAMLQNKIRFLNDIIYTIMTSRLSKQNLEELLEERNYLKINNSYNYLINMPMSSATTANINMLNNKYNSSLSEYEVYNSMPIIDMWKSELNEFMSCWNKQIA